MFSIRSFPKKNIKWWLARRAAIDFDPDFQRTSRVWKEKYKAFLIDSILNGFDVPKVYLADFTRHNIPSLNKGGKNYAVIDGKQRLSAIFGFMSDDFPLPRMFAVEAHPTIELGGFRFSAIKRDYPQIARVVENYVLDVKVVETDEPRKINDVFLRLNKASKALNGAEVRNAIIGSASDAIRDLAKDPFFVRRISFETDRSQEKNAAAKILYLEYQNGAAETKKAVLDRFVSQIEGASVGRFNRAVRRTRANLRLLSAVFENQDHLLGAQGHLPLYYLFISRLAARDRRRVREFLSIFERQRTRNRNRPVGAPGDRFLNSYDLASRSINDRASFESRLGIIRTRHAEWKRRGV